MACSRKSEEHHYTTVPWSGPPDARAEARCCRHFEPKERMKTLAMRTLRTSIIGLIVLGIFVFGAAGTLAYWQGWAFILVFTISTNIIGVYLALRDPALLERRMRAGPGAETR